MTSPPAATDPQNSKKSYGTILKSSALIGGSTAINLGLGLVRTKAMAVLLGPSGIGLFGIFTSISDLARTVAGLGIKSSGVRQIAEAVGTGDQQRIARTVTTLRRVALYSGAIGAILLVLLSKPVSLLSFGNYEYAADVALLALAAFFFDISEAQGALVQGMRRIADLARINVLGAFFGTVFGIVIVYELRDKGVVPSLVCVAAMSILTSWWYARKIKVERASITWQQTWQEASELVKLGIVFMVTGLALVGSGYVIRLIIVRDLGLKEAGLYQAAWGLAGLCIGFILQAMGADFYPRLTAVANDKTECNRLVNEQTEVGLLMAGPGILGAISFAPLVITTFYSQKFGGAVELLQWFCLGMFLRVVTWPIGFIILAKGEKKIFFWTEILTNVSYVALVWVGVKTLGLRGTGIACALQYTLNWLALYIIARRLTGFRASAINRRLVLIFTPLVTAAFMAHVFLPLWPAVFVGAAITFPSAYFSLKTLCQLIPLERLPRAGQKVIRLLGIKSN